MQQIAAGKRENGLWHVWVKIEGEWYGAIDPSLPRAFMLATDSILGTPVSRIVN